ncbi:entericidin A/B family lipoprotein [Fodinicurvata sediminis]|uniref:entericidin A/B family lipoprotein n=1 Tax=Fodinicurvata sediminis TaxID=1121832 RepID=UPI0003B65A0B|nr:entericidin A/B family lipoprotein [Fodinicurvata sediminis]
MTLSSVAKTPLLLVLLAFGATAALSACNTVEGMGQDTQAVGEATSDTARDVEEDMED